jgi:hypothetical protein
MDTGLKLRIENALLSRLTIGYTDGSVIIPGNQ